jgi:hypothetical protein
VRIAIHESAHAVCARVLRLRAGTIEGNMPLASFDDKGTVTPIATNRLSPEVLEPVRRQLGVAHRVLEHSRVPMAITAGLPGGRHQALDLGRRQVLAGAN